METLVVISILLVLLSMGTALSFSYLRVQRLGTATEIIAQEMTQARADAYVQTNDAAHGIKVLTDSVVRFEGTSYDTRDVTKDLVADFPGTVVVTGLTEVVFPSGSLTPQSSGTMTLTDGGASYTISVSLYGVVEWSKGAE